uniref:Uncharacterized protein n=1 Tax=Oryza sativa subsp. japonica TaxID=39947 RepID=Q69X89_ORYSJ|nr:hypothetical protein [Oryza sativa Japonica Group]
MDAKWMMKSSVRVVVIGKGTDAVVVREIFAKARSLEKSLISVLGRPMQKKLKYSDYPFELQEKTISSTVKVSGATVKIMDTLYPHGMYIRLGFAQKVLLFGGIALGGLESCSNWKPNLGVACL